MNTLYIVATPIGNLEDITIRAIKTLLSAPVVACEDTRHTGQLLKHLRDKYPQWVTMPITKFVSVRDWNEGESIDMIIENLQLTDVAMVSDAGTPLISDPGFKIVRAVRSAGFQVVPIPGVSAAITALSVAGLPTDKFIFRGFLAKKWDLIPGYTHVIYEAPTRANKTISELKEKYPNARIMVAQELTKVHESVEEYTQTMKFRGEVTILAHLPADSDLS